MGNIMVLNMGLKSIRCIIFDYDGVKLGSSAEPIKTAINDKCVEQSPDEWWEKAQLVMRRAVFDSKTKKIDFITVTTSASCLVCVDQNGNALMPALMISDKRAEKEAEKLQLNPVFQDVSRKTKLNSVSSLMLPKIMWVQNNCPEILGKTEHFFSSNDFFVFKLCGVAVTDYFNAAKYHYIIEERTYPQKLLEALGISIQMLPKVESVGKKAGTIKKEIADEIGINDTAAVVLSSYDAICSFVGSGVSDEGDSSDVSGTVTVFRTLSRKKVINPNFKIYDIPFYMENARIVGGSNNLGGGLIEWVKQCYYQKEEYPYEIMEKDAHESDVGAKGLIFLPYLLGERAPIWDDDARGVFFGLERMHTRKDMTRAVFESTGFIDMDMINAIQDTGVNVGLIRLSGGLTRLNLISQIKSDVFNRDVLVLSEFETTSTGAAMMALVGQSVFSDMKAAADKFVTVRMIIKPNKENHKKYKYMYEMYRDTYANLKELFKKRTDALNEIRNDKEVRIENL